MPSRASGVGRLLELLEDTLPVLVRDPDAGVAHRHPDAVVVPAGDDLDAAQLRGELDRVGQEVDHDLLDAALVGPDGAKVLGRVEPHVDAAARRALADHADALLEAGADVRVGEVQLAAAGLDLGEGRARR